MIQLEYKVMLITISEHGFPASVKETEFLNEQGKEGWELCIIRYDQYGSRFFYFKRQITENNPQ